MGTMTRIALSRIRAAAQSLRSASSYRTRSDASVPLSSPPCTFAAIQRIAGVLAASAEAVPAGVAGSMSFRAFAWTAARPVGVTFSGFPTIAYVSGRPSTECPKTPETTRGLAASTAATYSSASAEVTSWEPRSKPRTSFPVGTSPRKVGGVNGSQVGAAPTERVVPATTTTAHAKSVASAKESLPPKRRGSLTAFEFSF
jgi:hypothetical protein